eukprot:TRINITY_DN2610_c0_g2_i1.p2 TRINITY_DN2610_c0_g2~~TRINITY_DN2610_c0_g2_i1.p2  ORF type:complete len:321 (-),score=82.12 TRINITY_DN2610_c0_g2_i1:85-1047(-)
MARKALLILVWTVCVSFAFAFVCDDCNQAMLRVVCQNHQFGGACTCTAEQRYCNGECRDILSDESNCGACGSACAGVCTNGQCAVANCANGLSPCGQNCVNLLTDNNNCGVCNTQCNNGDGCVSGQCRAPVIVAAPPCPNFNAAFATYSWLLQNSFAEAHGLGNALVPHGGSVTSGGYVFQANQGLALDVPAQYADHYRFRIRFSFALTSGYRRILAFKERTTDNGFYALNGAANLYPQSTGSTVQVTANQVVDFIVTRDRNTKVFSVCQNGADALTLTDTDNIAVATVTNGVAKFLFFEDDLVVQGEASAGTAYLIQLM